MQVCQPTHTRKGQTEKSEANLQQKIEEKLRTVKVNVFPDTDVKNGRHEVADHFCLVGPMLTGNETLFI